MANGGGDNVLEIFSGWLNPFSTWPSLIPYLSWAMWFIPVYLIIMMILPVLKRCFFANSSFVRISPLILCPSLIILFQINNLGKYFLLWESVFYIFWVYIGFIFIQYVYGKSIQEKIKPCMICFICGSLSSVFLLAGGYANPDMQLNKFPPNGIFLCYTFTIMSIIILFIDQIHSVIRRIQRKVFCNGFFLFIVIAVIQFIYFIRLDF